MPGLKHGPQGVRSCPSFAFFSLAVALFFIMVFPQGALAKERRLVVAAASDLSLALKEIASGFEKETGITPTLSFGSTGNLSMQIEGGAPFDLFFSASSRVTDALDAKGLVEPGTNRPLARGRIALVSKKGAKSAPKDLASLADPSIRRISIANPAHAPYGVAAKEALVKSGLWDAVKDKLVYGENVRQALSYVETTDAEAGIVALSIVSAPEINYTLIDESLHKPIDQTVAIIKGASNMAEAKEFLSYVERPAAKHILKKYGFMLYKDTR